MNKKPRISNRDHGQYKAAFEAWMSEGTLDLAAKKLIGEGVVSFKGKPYSPAGVRWGAMRYMVLNYELTKPMLIENYEEHGYHIENDQIERYYIDMAKSTLGSVYRIKHWLIQHNLLEKHQKYIESIMTL